MLEPRPISKRAVPVALEKALRYRLLNEPLEAESICCDVLLTEPQNQQALVTLLLALSDQFESRFTAALEAAKGVLPQLNDRYQQSYYEGIIHERWAKAQLARGLPADAALGWFREALRCYDKAAMLAPDDEPEAILRYNTCVRFIERNEPPAPLARSHMRDVAAEYGDDVPLR